MIVFTIIALFLAMEFVKQVTSYQCSGRMETFTIDVYKDYCYMIGHKKRSFGGAYELCEIYGADLADIPEDDLRNVTNQSINIHQYWVGVIWTTSLNKWIWITDVKRSPEVERPGWWNVGSHCASYHVDNDKGYLKETDCQSALNPICKFALPNDTYRCFNMCSNINDNQSEVDSNFRNETSAELLNETTHVNMTSNRTDEVCDCQQSVELINDDIVTTLTLILGAVLFVSFVMNILTVCQIVRKYRKARAKRASKKNRISLIDILNVGGGDLTSGDTYEKMHYNDDNTTSQGPEKVPKSAENNGCDGLSKNNKDFKVSSSHFVEAKNLNDQSCAYSALDHKVANLTAGDPSHVYGIDSGSVHSSPDEVRNDGIREKSDVENTEPLYIYSNVEPNYN